MKAFRIQLEATVFAVSGQKPDTRELLEKLHSMLHSALPVSDGFGEFRVETRELRVEVEEIPRVGR